MVVRHPLGHRLGADDVGEPQSREKALSQISPRGAPTQSAAASSRLYLRLLAERREVLGLAPFTERSVMESAQEILVASHLHWLEQRFVANPPSGVQRFYGDVLVVFASKREDFFVNKLGLTEVEASVYAIERYWNVVRQLTLEGSHHDVCMRCI